MALEIQRVEFPRDTATFVKTWWTVYRDDPQWVPPLVFERKRFFDPSKNPYFRVATVQGFLARRDGVPVGTLCATIDHELLKHEPGVGLFGFFEFVDDPEVSAALFQAGAAWLREKGMTVARGPFNFNSNHEFGLLVEGFDTPPMIANPHNSAYFPRHYDKIGLAKAMDWFAYWIDNGTVPKTVAAISERTLKRNPEITLRPMNMKRFDQEVELFREIYNDAWERNWGHVQLTEAEFRFTAAGLRDALDERLCWFAFVGDEVAAASITLPDYNQVVKKMNGSLFPFGWYHFLTGRRRIDALRVFVLGVKQKFQHLPLGAPLYVKTWEEGSSRPIRGAEASLILETNHRMRGALEKLGARVYKTYRTYELPLV